MTTPMIAVVIEVATTGGPVGARHRHDVEREKLALLEDVEASGHRVLEDPGQ